MDDVTAAATNADPTNTADAVLFILVIVVAPQRLLPPSEAA